MRLCIRSIFILTQWLTALPDLFTFVSATTTTRSTPAPLGSPRTKFEELQFWSGESLNSKRKWQTTKGANEKNNHSASKQQLGRDGRRRRYESEQSVEHGKLTYTRFAGSVDAESTTQRTSNESLSRRLNGYSILDEMQLLMADLKANATVTSLAKTVEVHDIVLVKITQKKPGRYFRALEGEQKYVTEEPQKKIILIVHGLSAMGFRNIPCLYNRYSFMKLVNMYIKHLDKFDIFLMPMVNVDGISDETLLMWNKNKSPNAACTGVDIDRNFDVEFEKNHTVKPCSQRYPGAFPFSEPESRAVADIIHHYNHKIVAFINVHAGAYNDGIFKGDAVLYPKGYESVSTDDKYSDIGAGIEETLRNAGFKTFDVSVTSLYKWYGKVSGTSVDYATSIYGIPFGLEFVMQPYTERYEVAKESDEITDNILTEVWSRIIDAVVHVIHKTTSHILEEDEVKKRK